MLVNLAYLGVRTPAIDQWPAFACEVLGMQQAASAADGALRFRVDDAAWRIQIHRNDTDTLGYFGWTAESSEFLDEMQERLAGQGITATFGDADLCENRCVARLLAFRDPSGFDHEIVFAQSQLPATFHPGRAMSGFKTGGQGLGHMVFLVPDFAKADDFYRNVMGFKLSDRVSINGREVRFYHLAGRHHSLAIAGGPPDRAGLNHLMIETKSMLDVGTAYDIVQERNIPLMMTLGQHANDLMTSFYVNTPSTFHIEYGFGGVSVDDADWVPVTYHQNSLWGHKRHESGKDLAPAVFRELNG